MKKNGFTLAEVLVTLGIIGVVAALTTPALIENIGNAKIVPKLQKGKATFETAAQMMLVDNSMKAITDLVESKGENGKNGSWSSEELGDELAKYMKITRKNDKYDIYSYTGNTPQRNWGSGAPDNDMPYVRYDSEDGITYWIWQWHGISHPHSDWADIPNNQIIGSVAIDINGSEKPNRIAKDFFPFWMYNDGTLRPEGGIGANRTKSIADQENASWKNGYCDNTKILRPGTCTGSIYDNGMKIIYQ